MTVQSGLPVDFKHLFTNRDLCNKSQQSSRLELQEVFLAKRATWRTECVMDFQSGSGKETQILDPQTHMAGQTTQADVKPQIASLIPHNTQTASPPAPTSTPGMSQTPGGIKTSTRDYISTPPPSPASNYTAATVCSSTATAV